MKLVIMNVLKIILLVYLLPPSQSSKKIGTFWHISDTYWSNKFNSENCSTSLTACESQTLDALMRKTGKLHPDFVLWSSAGGPHLKSVVRQMKKAIRNIVVLPALSPVKLPAADKYILYYQNISDYFGQWLTENARHTFWKAGYYSQSLGIPENLQVIVLNTALFCNFHVASQLDDPANQWTWLFLQLIKAREERKTVYLLLSATPGIAGTYEKRMLTPQHNRRYIAMVQTFSDVIKGQFGGYEEGNKFHMFYDKNERGCGWLMLSSPYPDTARLYIYDTETLEPLDYVQYYKTDQTWHMHHRFSSYYFLPNLSVFSLELLLTRMQKDEDMYAKYIAATKFAQESNSTTRCANKLCSKANTCNIMAVDYSAYLECVAQDSTRYLYSPVTFSGSCRTIAKLLLVTCFFTVPFHNKCYG